MLQNFEQRQMTQELKSSESDQKKGRSIDQTGARQDFQPANDFSVKLNSNSSVRKVFGVLSGKGGVGKSIVTSMMAVSMQRQGYKVAILDADLTGPSIPKVFGIKGKAHMNANMIEPIKTETGISVISINLMLDSEEDPVIWRGPLLGKIVKQFWSDVQWGEIDFMFIDMPPGTGDVPLTVFQSLNVDGLIIVTSPQDLVSMIVAKAVNMAEKMNIPIWGLVENMSYFECPKCHEQVKIFGESHIERVAEAHGLKIFARIPILKELALLCDEGQIERFEGDWFNPLVESLEASIE
jgi:Mrp family chromosome partitioning ATPase